MLSYKPVSPALKDKMPSSPSAVIAEFTDDIPVDLDAMADRLGIPVFYDHALPNDVSGKISRDKRAKAGFEITIHANDSDGRRRFTLAHEIAHYVLHRDLIDHLVDNAMYRSNLSSQFERQANHYAAKILLPAEAVRKQFKEIPNTLILAYRFKVSERAMKIRVSELGLA